MSRLRRTAVSCTQMLCGGAGYGALEILWRGYTHISMVLIGGLCFCYLLRLSKSALPLPVQCMAGGAGITAVEFVSGCLLNLVWQLDVWDYSHEAFHFLGQICLKYSLIWCGLCLLVLPLCRFLRANFHGLRWTREAEEPGTAYHS